MRSTLFAIITALLVGCVTTPDQIDHLVAFLSAPGYLRNGKSLEIGDDSILPSTASPEQLIKTVFDSRALQGFLVTGVPVTNYEILKIKQVHIRGLSPDAYTAALVRTNVGGKIILLQYYKPGREWSIVLFDCDVQRLNR